MKLSQFKCRVIVITFFSFLFLSNCVANSSGARIVDTPEMNLCAPGFVAEVVKPLTALMQAFDDTTDIAYYMPRPQVSAQITELQSYRRQVTMIEVPSCLLQLKAAQIKYMDSVINTLLAFLGGAKGEVTISGLEISLQFRARYENELTNLLGVTSTPRPTTIALSEGQLIVSSPTGTQISNSSTPSIVEVSPTVIPVQDTATPTPFSAMAVVSNPEGVNVRFGPGVLYGYDTVIPQYEELEILGKSENGEWLLVADSSSLGALGWIFAPLVQLDISIEKIPIKTFVFVTDTPTP